MSASTTQVRTQSPLAARVRLALMGVFAVLALIIAGCGGGEKAKDDVVLAKVGDKAITGSYYEDRLSLLEKNELPKDDNGKPMDMATQAGKEKLLETLITKEVMTQTALAMGYANEPQIAAARKSMMAYQAAMALAADEINVPANTISEEHLQDYYSKMGLVRTCRYVVTNFLPDAEAAAQLARTGADWDEVVGKYHDGDPDPKGEYKLTVPFGRYNSSFGDAVFAPQVGEVTDPVETVYGYWVLKIESEKEGKRPSLEDAKAQILDAARARKIATLQKALRDRVHKKFNLVIHEDALLKCYKGLPAKEEMFYPGTKDPVKREDLEPLNIPTVDREMPFYSYTNLDGDEVLASLGDYKTHFDRMSVFQRPKRSEMLGGLRQKITAELDNALMNFEARDKGYYENEDVLLKVNAKVEEMLVNKLYDDLVTYDKQISPEELDAFWAEHEADYFVPETRNGRLVVCATEAMAKEATDAIGDGVPWRDILVKYGTDADNKSRSGKLNGVREDNSGAVGAALFSLNEGEVSQPLATEDGRFGVVVLDAVVPPHQRKLKEVAKDVGARMQKIRQEDAFQAMLAKWKANLTIETYPENLAGLKSWQELTTPPAPGNPVPRN